MLNESKIERVIYLGDFSCVQIANDGVGDAHAMQIANDRVEALAIDVVGDQAPGVAHERGHVGRFAAGRGTRVQYAFVLVWRERHHGQHARGALDHVVAGQVLGRGAHGHLRVVHDQADLGPLAQRVQVDAAVNERLGEIATPRLQRVGAYRHRPLALVRLQELDELAQREQVHELLD